MTDLQFQLFSSFVDVNFWHVFAKNKLNVYGLSEKAVPINGFFGCSSTPNCPDACRLHLTGDAFDEKGFSSPPFCFKATGFIQNYNTFDAFRDTNKNEILLDSSRKLWDDIVSGEAWKDPSCLIQFVLLSFADLKTWKFQYWAAFPGLAYHAHVRVAALNPLNHLFNQKQVESLREQYDVLRAIGAPAALAKYSSPPCFAVRIAASGDVIVGHLADVDTWTQAGTPLADVLFGFADPGSVAHSPGWPLRNLLVLLSYRLRISHVTVLCYREGAARHDLSASFLLTLDLQLPPTDECPKAYGWERNAQGKYTPRVVDLAPIMDPYRLAESSVELNVRLMRWRMAPSLDPDAIATTKCLLIGAGTLGCAVARNLLGWGVRDMTLVDSGRVSYSNPPRQSLFQFDDCSPDAKLKAIAAVDAIKRILPAARAVGEVLEVPMPGHAVADVDASRNALQRLDKLVRTHDVVFLLTDSRESRWLPTLLAAAHGKIAINAALGFDSYLVMRHGVTHSRPVDTTAGPPHAPRLGCYFCNDVIGPSHSGRERTLDQQCTVSRPGLANIAAGLAVELMVSILHHPARGAAPTFIGNNHPSRSATDAAPAEADTDGLLGPVPHQIRGSVGSWSQMLLSSCCFDKCTACSDTVLSAYRCDGFAFVRRCLDDAKHLEDISGLTELREQSLAAAKLLEVDAEWADSESERGSEGAADD